MDNIYWLDQISPHQHSQVGDRAFHLSRLRQQGYPVIAGFVISARWFREFLETIEWSDPLFFDLAHSSLRLNVEDARQLQAISQQIRQTILLTPLPIVWAAELEATVQALPSIPGQTTQAVILRPSLALASSTLKGWGTSLPSGAADLLEAQVCWSDQTSLETGLKQLWAEMFRARNLIYWQRSTISLHQIHLAVLVQPIGAAIASGYLQNSQTDWEILATWGLEPAIANGEVLPDLYRLNIDHSTVSSQTLGSKTIAYCIGPSPIEPADFQTGNAVRHPLQLASLNEAQDQQFVLEAEQLQQFVQLAGRLTTDFESRLVLEWALYHTDRNQAQLYLTQIKVQDDALTAQPIESALTNLDDCLNQGFGTPIVSGLAAASGRAIAQASVLTDLQHLPIDLKPGTILVTSVIMPDCLPLLKQSVGVVAEQGGMTSHGAIIARELGIPAVVGAMQATQRIKTGDFLLIDGSRGTVYEATAALKREFADRQAAEMATSRRAATEIKPPISTQLMVNLSQSDRLDHAASLAVDGLGLLRSELMVMEILDRQHPQRWLQTGRQAELVNRLSTQISKFARAFAPRPVFYRSLDLRSHEFRALEGGNAPFETNPMLGVRGTFSYVLNPALFEAELAALSQVYQAGYSNVRLVLPFVRTVEEFIFCRQRVEQAGLTHHPDFQLWIMAEVPSVLFLLPEYVQVGVQGIVIGISDLTQLLLGVDRDQGLMALTFDEHHPAVLRAIAQLIETAHKLGIPCSICGLAPVQHPSLIDSLVQWGITAISVNLDAVESTYHALNQAEQKRLGRLQR